MISPTLSSTRTTLALTFSSVCVARRRHTVRSLLLNVALNWVRAFIARVRSLAEYAHGSCIQLLCAEIQFTLWSSLLLIFFLAIAKCRLKLCTSIHRSRSVTRGVCARLLQPASLRGNSIHPMVIFALDILFLGSNLVPRTSNFALDLAAGFA
jgi:hypothetical protein